MTCPEVVKTSEAILLADDCLLNRHIRHDEDSSDLYTDLTALEDWERKLPMHFHHKKKKKKKKKKVIGVCTNKRLMKNISYQLHGHVLDSIDSTWAST